MGQKQSDFVRFGRKYFVAGDAVAEYPIAVAGLATLICAAMVPPTASILMLYSPSARQSAPPPLQGAFVVPCVLNEKRGSKGFDELGLIAGNV